MKRRTPAIDAQKASSAIMQQAQLVTVHVHLEPPAQQHLRCCRGQSTGIQDPSPPSSTPAPAQKLACKPQHMQFRCAAQFVYSYMQKLCMHCCCMRVVCKTSAEAAQCKAMKAAGVLAIVLLWSVFYLLPGANP